MSQLQQEHSSLAIRPSPGEMFGNGAQQQPHRQPQVSSFYIRFHSGQIVFVPKEKSGLQSISRTRSAADERVNRNLFSRRHSECRHQFRDFAWLSNTYTHVLVIKLVQGFYVMSIPFQIKIPSNNVFFFLNSFKKKFFIPTVLGDLVTDI